MGPKAKPFRGGRNRTRSPCPALRTCRLPASLRLTRHLQGCLLPGAGSRSGTCTLLSGWMGVRSQRGVVLTVLQSNAFPFSRGCVGGLPAVRRLWPRAAPSGQRQCVLVACSLAHCLPRGCPKWRWYLKLQAWPGSDRELPRACQLVVRWELSLCLRVTW